MERASALRARIAPLHACAQPHSLDNARRKPLARALKEQEIAVLAVARTALDPRHGCSAAIVVCAMLGFGKDRVRVIDPLEKLRHVHLRG